MKIEKLYTLSMFVTQMEDYTHESHNYERACKKIIKYNDFLKRPLKKEMFVNEVPTLKGTIGENIISNWREYEEAQKKVIFKGWTKGVNGTIDNVNYPEIEISKAMRISVGFHSPFTEYKSLHDLAESTNGKLETINIEL